MFAANSRSAIAAPSVGQLLLPLFAASAIAVLISPALAHDAKPTAPSRKAGAIRSPAARTTIATRCRKPRSASARKVMSSRTPGRCWPTATDASRIRPMANSIGVRTRLASMPARPSACSCRHRLTESAVGCSGVSLLTGSCQDRFFMVPCRMDGGQWRGDVDDHQGKLPLQGDDIRGF